MPLKEKIPSHWDWKELQDFSDRLRSTTDPAEAPDTEFEYYSIPFYDEGKGAQLVEGREINSRKRELHGGELMISRLNPRKERVWAVSSSNKPKIASTEFVALDLDEKVVRRDFLYYFLKSKLVTNTLMNKVTASTKSRKRVAYDEVMSIKIPIPPLEEQKDIVNKLDGIFEDIEEIQDAQEQAEKIYQDLAFSFFTSRVKDAETDKLDTGDLIESSQYGSSNATNSEGDGYPSLRMGNYNLRGEMDYSKIKYQEFEDDEEFEKYKLEKGDVLFNRTNSKDLVGKMCVYDGGLDDAVFASYLIRVNLNEDKVLPEYFVTYMNSHLGEIERQGKLKQAVSQANINATELREMKMAVPSLERQQEIVESLNYMRSKIDDIKSDVERKGQLVDTISDSVLAEAFKGNLVDFAAEDNSDTDKYGSTGESNNSDSNSDIEDQHRLEDFD